MDEIFIVVAPGEVGVIMLISADRAQSQTLLRYIKSLLHSNPVLKQYPDKTIYDIVKSYPGVGRNIPDPDAPELSQAEYEATRPKPK